jgi:5'-deoxynucleotidase YfbR-like HD superfamily hydrolase
MTKEDILAFYKEFRVPKHVIGHMETVSKISTTIADRFIEKGIPIDKDLLEKAALLHDTIRVCDFRDFKPETFPQETTQVDIDFWLKLREKYGEIGHVKAIAHILKVRNETALANLVEKHDFKEVNNLKTWEEKILYYADKRADGNKVADIETRLTKGFERNKQANKDYSQRDKIIQSIRDLEEEIEREIGKLSI